MRFPTIVLIGFTLAGACERPGTDAEARALARRVLGSVLVYPGSSLGEVSAGQEAAQLTLSVPADVERVRAWYRQSLPLNGWELKQDIVAPDGTRVMYFEKERRPLWVTLRESVGGPGTSYTLIGAEVRGDSVQ